MRMIKKTLFGQSVALITMTFWDGDDLIYF